MTHGAKVALIIAAVLLISGCCIFIAVMTCLKWNFSLLTHLQLETNSHSITESFRNICIDTGTADIVFAPAEGDSVEVVCKEQAGITHSVSVQDGTLRISVIDNRQWYLHLFSVGKQSICIYLPQQEYASLTIQESTGKITIPADFRFSDMCISLSTGDTAIGASVSGDMRIQASTGDIRLENLSAGSIQLTVSTGNISLSNVDTEGNLYANVSTGKVSFSQVRCKNLYSTGSTGDMNLVNVLAAENFHLKRSTGAIQFSHCDATDIFVETDTGNVTGSLLTNKIIFAKTDTGKVDIPHSLTGGKCEITTDTGDIKITIE